MCRPVVWLISAVQPIRGSSLSPVERNLVGSAIPARCLSFAGDRKAGSSASDRRFSSIAATFQVPISLKDASTMNMIRRGFIAGIAVAAMALSSTAARADLFGKGLVAAGSQTVGVVDATLGISNTFNTEYHTLLSPNASGTPSTDYISYCVDLLHGLPGTFTQLDNNPFGGPPPGPLPLTNTFPSATSPDNGQVDAASFGRAAWIANAFGLGTPSDLVRSAVQIAIWKTEYESNPADYTNMGAGSISFSGNAAAIALAQSYLITANRQTSYALWVDYVDINGTHQQHQLIPVPEPSTLAVAGLGALGFIGYGWKRRKRS
jgi:hypothetical protein